MDNYDINDPIKEAKKTQETRYRPIENKGYIKQKWFAFGCLSAVILIIIFLLVALSGIIMLGRSKIEPIPTGTYLNLRIVGALEEYREIDQDLFSFTTTLSARDIIDRINKAANDPNIKGIILEPRFVAAGYSTLNEITIALENFKAKGKPVYAYLEMAANRDYYLASVSTEIFLHPSASSGIYLSGVGVSSLYMKDLFDKLGVEWTILHSGEFKGAGEEFSRREMSPQMRQSLTLLLDDLYSQLLTDISSLRNLDFNIIREIYEDRPEFLINQDYALEMDIVDFLASRDDMLDMLGISEDKVMRISRYRTRTSSRTGHSNKVAVVYLQGSITIPSSSFGQNIISAGKVKNIIADIEKDPSIKAIVLRIKSPGGSALESDKIYQQLIKLKSTKPLVVSMSDIAASGGYYIAAPGDYIMADPYTITGSIGVAAMIPNLHQTGQKIGVNPQTMYRGKYTNFMNTWERPNPSDILALQRSLDSTYEEFKERVSTGRNMTSEEVEKVAQGMIWSSKRALANNLIDDIGNLDQAVEKAAELANMIDYQTVYLPETKTLWELLLERRFDRSIILSIITSNVITDERLEDLRKIYTAIKNDPVQMLSPLLYVD
ncbi:MAG: signal peptide peptidase SppA [Candidatus Cloacimonetes bacterium]|nr:signal peptide peptidase SppA [Candidatus Cloacimonadota bacterium]